MNPKQAKNCGATKNQTVKGKEGYIRKRKANSPDPGPGRSSPKKKKMSSASSSSKSPTHPNRDGNTGATPAAMAQSSGTPEMQKTLETILSSIGSMRTELNGRIDKLEEGLVEKVKKVVKEEVASVKTELDTQIASLSSELERVKGQLEKCQAKGDSLKLNVVISGIKQTPQENIVDKVNRIIKEGVKSEVVVKSATRKESRKEGKEGVVIATFSCEEDKQTVMDNKAKLARSEQYKHISIFHDRPYEQRVQRSNMKILIDLVYN